MGRKMEEAISEYKKRDREAGRLLATQEGPFCSRFIRPPWEAPKPERRAGCHLGPRRHPLASQWCRRAQHRPASLPGAAQGTELTLGCLSAGVWLHVATVQPARGTEALQGVPQHFMCLTEQGAPGRKRLATRKGISAEALWGCRRGGGVGEMLLLPGFARPPLPHPGLGAAGGGLQT